jgi:hypothetical protein
MFVNDAHQRDPVEMGEHAGVMAPEVADSDNSNSQRH